MKYYVFVKLRKDFIEVDGDKIMVGVLAPPEKGKANAEVIEKISKHLNVPRSAVRIVSGASSKMKLIEIN